MQLGYTKHTDPYDVVGSGGICVFYDVILKKTCSFCANGIAEIKKRKIHKNMVAEDRDDTRTKKMLLQSLLSNLR